MSNIWPFTGPLPPPEGIHVSESNNSLVIEWNPPYSVINTNSSVMHIDPHIIQYTVYIVDNYTNYVEKVNVTETSFRRNIPNDNSCPMYRVTAWNSGGEGNMSVPLPGARGKLPLLGYLPMHNQTDYAFILLYSSSQQYCS